MSNQDFVTRAKLSASFHKSWMQRIKKEMKGKCTYISHVTSKGEFFIKAIVKNEVGGKDTVHFKLTTPPEQITSKDYQSLLEVLKTAGYDSRTGSTEALRPSSE